MVIELNKYQEKAVTYYGEKPLLVEAGPGSGKTRVIIERVKFLILEKGMDPKSFLIITFSRKAANELRMRLSEYFDKETVDLMQISTIHSFCSKLLNDANKPFKVIDDDSGTRKNMFVLKHLEELGFHMESELPRKEVAAVIDAFDEYTTFNVDSEKLIDWIEVNEPVSQDYIDFINQEFMTHGKFPRKKIDLDRKNVKNSHGYKDSWYNAKHLQTAKAYPRYLKLLERENLMDFNLLQLKALDHLRKNQITEYKNILVDEFQDTDPIQMEIIELLMNYAYSTIDMGNKEELLENNEFDVSFTAVGDIDQSIYGFRGALNDYFKHMRENYDTKRLSLNTNYRSTEEIIRLSENLIKGQRDLKSKKKLEGNRQESRKIYYMESEDRNDEARKLLDIVINLKKNGIVEKYSDIAILYRSVTSSSGELIEAFKENGIPYRITGLKGLDDYDEIKSFITLLHYVIQDPREDEMPIFTSWQKDWLNLTAFTSYNFDQKMADLSLKTQQILIQKELEFRDNVLNMGKAVYNEVHEKKCRKRSFNGILDLEDEILEIVFRRVKPPLLSVENLISWGVDDEDDLEFFTKLDELRSKIIDVPFHERPTILDVYYSILEISGFLRDELIRDDEYQDAIRNMGILTQIMYDYENIISNRDIRGLYWFLNANLSSYGPENDHDAGVSMMTVHKSKGLEFPVVIISSLNEDSFPKNYEDLSRMQYHNGKPVFYTPPYCLEYKDEDDDELLLHCFEEERILYVGMTRAEDLLILSKTKKKTKSSKYVKNLEEKLEELRKFSNISKIKDEIDDLKSRENIDRLADRISVLEEQRATLNEIHKKVSKTIENIILAKEESDSLNKYLNALECFISKDNDNFDFGYGERIIELIGVTGIRKTEEISDDDSIDGMEDDNGLKESFDNKSIVESVNENNLKENWNDFEDEFNAEDDSSDEDKNSPSFDIFDIELSPDIISILEYEMNLISDSIEKKEKYIEEKESKKLYDDKDLIEESIEKLDKTIDDLKEKEKYEDFEDIYDLNSKDEWIVIKELEELEGELIEKGLNTGKFKLLISNIRLDEFKRLLEITDDEINEKAIIKREKVKYLFRIKDYEKIDLIDELKSKEELSRKTLNLFKRIHWKNQEIEEVRKLEQVKNHQNILNNIIEENSEIIENIDYGLMDDDYFRPNIEIESNGDSDESSQIRLSYSSIENYESCPLQYNLNYNFKFRVSDNSAITYGNISHNALEEINNLILKNKEIYLQENAIDEEDFDFNDMTNELFICRDDIEEIVRIHYDGTPNIKHNDEDRKKVIDNVFAYWINHGNEMEVLESEYPFEIEKEGYRLKGFIDLIYRDDDGIVVLDYKTTDNIYESKRKKYKKQLLTYALALKEDPKYKDENVSKLQIYAIKSGEMLDIEFTDEDLTGREKDIGEIAENIHNGYYPKLDIDEGNVPRDCKWCKFKFICGVDKLLN